MITGEYITKKETADRIGGFMYIRDSGRKPIGLVVWDKDGRLGWSLYNDDYETEAFSDKGLLIALHRAETISDPIMDLSRRIMKMREYRTLYGDDSRLVRAIAVIRHIKDQVKRELKRQNESEIAKTNKKND